MLSLDREGNRHKSGMAGAKPQVWSSQFYVQTQSITLGRIFEHQTREFGIDSICNESLTWGIICYIPWMIQEEFGILSSVFKLDFILYESPWTL